MRSFALFLAGALSLAAAPALAHPGHGASSSGHDERDFALPLVARKGTLNDTSDAGASNTSIADDHVPSFKTADCVCPDPVCDSRLNAASVSSLSLSPSLSLLFCCCCVSWWLLLFLPT